MNSKKLNILIKAWRKGKLRAAFVHFQEGGDAPLAFTTGKILQDGLRQRGVPTDFLLEINGAKETIDLCDKSNWDPETDPPKIIEPLPTDKAFNFNGYGEDFSKAMINHFKEEEAIIVAGIYSDSCMRGAVRGFLRHTSAHVFAPFDGTNGEKSPKSYKKALLRPPLSLEGSISLTASEHDRLHTGSIAHLLGRLDL